MMLYPTWLIAALKAGAIAIPLSIGLALVAKALLELTS